MYIYEKLTLQYRAAALNLGSTDSMGVHEQISGVPEFGWGKNYNFTFTNLWLKFSCSFTNNVGNKVIYGL